MSLKKKMLSLGIVSSLLMSSAIPFAVAEEVEKTASVKPTYQITQKAKDIAKTKQLAQNKPVILKQMEYLNRGVVAIPSSEGVLITWRMLGTDSTDIKFNVYRDGRLLTKAPISKTNYLDKSAPKSAVYDVIPVLHSVEVKEDKGSATTQNEQYISIPVKQYDGVKYGIDDASVGDLDGDGDYEVVVRRSTNMNLKTRTGYPLIEAYKMDGTHMWTVDIGPNEVNSVDINFLVYDFDKDGKAELVTRSFEGTIDGVGTKLGDLNNDGKTNYEYSIMDTGDRQYLSEGPEYLSVYEGTTGKELARTALLPVRDPVTAWGGFPDLGRNTKRASHFLFSVAYLDGVTPSIVHVRGAWNAVGLAAWNFKDNKLGVVWELPISKSDELYGTGYHSMAVADVDFDGKDEILSGSFAVDNDGKIMYATKVDDVKLGHGDAFDVAKMNPDYDGFLIWSCQEFKGLPISIGLHDARTGEVLFGWTKPKDTGRSRAADIDPTNRGWEMWGSTNTPIQNFKGEFFTGKTTASAVSINMKLYWDGDLLSELFDYSDYNKTTYRGIPTVQKWNWERKIQENLFKCEGSYTEGTKGNPQLIADIFGDWRDEIMTKKDDDTEIRIYSTNIPTDYRIPTLMHDVTYRESVAWQNNHYNQPTNVSFYMGAETTEVPIPEIYTMKNGNKIVNPVYTDSSNKSAKTEILMKDTYVESKPIVLKINSSKAIIDGKIRPIDADNTDVTPIIDNDRTLVPLRFLSESFGATVQWDGQTRTVTLTRGSDVVKMVIDKNLYNVNGEDKMLDAPAKVINNRTMVPIRAILEVFGQKLFWNNGIIAIGETMPEPTAKELSSWDSQI